MYLKILPQGQDFHQMFFDSFNDPPKSNQQSSGIIELLTEQNSKENS